MAVAVVSIIIPTYNRAHLIGETLDSILKQTYTNWECIVIDDGSTDATEEVMDDYLNSDSRVYYHHRPHKHLPGGNGARNYGLSLAQGDYVIFFDSDDLMTEDHVQIKIDAIETSGVDYVITKTKFYNSDKSLEHNYRFDEYEISLYNYITQKINWLTYDTLIKSSLAKQISFNEHLKSGQEYNYFSKMVAESIQGKFIDRVLTLRRYHKDSIRTNLSKVNATKGAFKTLYTTYKELNVKLTVNEKKGLLFKIVKLVHRSPESIEGYFWKFYYELYLVYNYNSFNFLLMFILNKFGKGYKYRQALKKESS